MFIILVNLIIIFTIFYFILIQIILNQMKKVGFIWKIKERLIDSNVLIIVKSQTDFFLALIFIKFVVVTFIKTNFFYFINSDMLNKNLNNIFSNLQRFIKTIGVKKNSYMENIRNSNLVEKNKTYFFNSNQFYLIFKVLFFSNIKKNIFQLFSTITFKNKYKNVKAYFRALVIRARYLINYFSYFVFRNFSHTNINNFYTLGMNFKLEKIENFIIKIKINFDRFIKKYNKITFKIKTVLRKIFYFDYFKPRIEKLYSNTVDYFQLLNDNPLVVLSNLVENNGILRAAATCFISLMASYSFFDLMYLDYILIGCVLYSCTLFMFFDDSKQNIEAMSQEAIHAVVALFLAGFYNFYRFYHLCHFMELGEKFRQAVKAGPETSNQFVERFIKENSMDYFYDLRDKLDILLYLIDNEFFCENIYTFAVKGFLAMLFSVLLIIFIVYNNNQFKFSFKAEAMFFLVMAFMSTYFLVLSINFISLFISLEMLSFCLYYLTVSKSNDSKASESSLKYLIMTAIATFSLLIGGCLLFYVTGDLSFYGYVSSDFSGSSNCILFFSIIFIIIGFIFKIGGVPYHFWTLDLYEAAPLPIVTFFATVVKFAIILTFIKLFIMSFIPFLNSHLVFMTYVQYLLIFFGLLSIGVGILGTLYQKKIKRLIAYSSVANIGYIFLALACLREFPDVAVANAILFSVIYVISLFGIFACLNLLSGKSTDSMNLVYINQFPKLFNNVYYKFLCVCFVIFFMSLAGIPPVAGFFGKAIIFISLGTEGFFLVILFVLIGTVVSTFYYLRIIQKMIFSEKKIDKKSEPYNLIDKDKTIISEVQDPAFSEIAMVIICICLYIIIFSVLYLSKVYTYTVFMVEVYSKLPQTLLCIDEMVCNFLAKRHKVDVHLHDSIQNIVKYLKKKPVLEKKLYTYYYITGDVRDYLVNRARYFYKRDFSEFDISDKTFNFYEYVNVITHNIHRFLVMKYDFCGEYKHLSSVKGDIIYRYAIQRVMIFDPYFSKEEFPALLNFLEFGDKFQKESNLSLDAILNIDRMVGITEIRALNENLDYFEVLLKKLSKAFPNELPMEYVDEIKKHIQFSILHELYRMEFDLFRDDMTLDEMKLYIWSRNRSQFLGLVDIKLR